VCWGRTRRGWENPRACYEPADADARLPDRCSSKTKPPSCGNQTAHESLFNRRLSVLSLAADVLQELSAWLNQNADAENAYLRNAKVDVRA
jgi:hypothetical protein